MMIKHKKPFNLTFLFLFLLTILSANFLHTEKTLSEDNDCPACQFQHSSLTTAHINFFSVPSLSFFYVLKSSESFDYDCIFSVPPNSRSPPKI